MGFLGGTPFNWEILKLLIKFDHKVSYFNLTSLIRVSIVFFSFETSSRFFIILYEDKDEEHENPLVILDELVFLAFL